MEVGHRRRLAVAHDLDTALVDVPLRERFESFGGAHEDGRTSRLHDSTVLHLRDADRRDRRSRRDRGVAFHASLQLVHRQLLSVDVEAKVIGDRQLSRTFRQLDDQLIAVDRACDELDRIAPDDG